MVAWRRDDPLDDVTMPAVRRKRRPHTHPAGEREHAREARRLAYEDRMWDLESQTPDLFAEPASSPWSDDIGREW